MKIPDPQLMSKLGPRANYGLALFELANNFENVVASSADLGISSGLARFIKTYPDKFINAGIAEQNLIGMSAGVAREGFVVFASSFAPFLTMRSLEQVRMNLGYMEANVKLVGLGSGLSMGFLGNSHFGLEDIAVMKTIPGMHILTPADGVELYKSIEWAYQHIGPVYIRLTGVPGYMQVHDLDIEIDPNKVHELRKGSDLLVIAHGAVLSEVVSALNRLENIGIGSTLIGLSFIKPFPEEVVAAYLSNFSQVVVVEEHTTIGGLADSLSRTIVSRNLANRVLFITLPDEYCETGSYDYLLNFHKLNASGIEKQITEFLDW